MLSVTMARGSPGTNAGPQMVTRTQEARQMKNRRYSKNRKRKRPEQRGSGMVYPCPHPKSNRRLRFRTCKSHDCSQHAFVEFTIRDTLKDYLDAIEKARADGDCICVLDADGVPIKRLAD